MDGYTLLRDWPALSKANAETVFDSPAWRLETADGEGVSVLTKAETPVADLLWVTVTLEDEPHVLGIGDAEAFADLHRLWSRRSALPEELLLALVERECGPLFQMLEKALRRQLRLKGLSTGPTGESARRVDFELSVNGSVFAFALDLTPLLITELGRVMYLNPGHESIRALRRPAWVEYAAVDLLECEFADLAKDDRIVLPENCAPVWRVTVPEDDRGHLRMEAAGEVTFGQMADEDWPAQPEPGRVVLLKNGRTVARGRLESLGLQKVFRVEEAADHV